KANPPLVSPLPSAVPSRAPSPHEHERPQRPPSTPPTAARRTPSPADVARISSSRERYSREDLRRSRERSKERDTEAKILHDKQVESIRKTHGLDDVMVGSNTSSAVTTPVSTP